MQTPKDSQVMNICNGKKSLDGFYRRLNRLMNLMVGGIQVFWDVTLYHQVGVS
jgi:hypothetical protein